MIMSDSGHMTKHRRAIEKGASSMPAILKRRVCSGVYGGIHFMVDKPRLVVFMSPYLHIFIS